jgi:glutaredoxin 3
MSKVVIYTQLGCKLSQQAKNLIATKGVNFDERDITYDVLVKREMIELSGGRVITPQIFVDGRHIGGCDDLFHLDKKGLFGKSTITKQKKAS